MKFLFVLFCSLLTFILLPFLFLVFFINIAEINVFYLLLGISDHRKYNKNLIMTPQVSKEIHKLNGNTWNERLQTKVHKVIKSF